MSIIVVNKGIYGHGNISIDCGEYFKGIEDVKANLTLEQKKNYPK